MSKDYVCIFKLKYDGKVVVAVGRKVEPNLYQVVVVKPHEANLVASEIATAVYDDKTPWGRVGGLQYIAAKGRRLRTLKP